MLVQIARQDCVLERIPQRGIIGRGQEDRPHLKREGERQPHRQGPIPPAPDPRERCYHQFNSNPRRLDGVTDVTGSYHVGAALCRHLAR